MLLIVFCGKFSIFYKLFMQKLLSQSKNEEFESNSALQIREQKERRAKNTKKLELQENFHSLRNFRMLRNFCKMNFHRLHCSSCENSILQHYSPFCHYSPFLLFDAVTFLLQFFVPSRFISCNSFWFWFFCNFPYSEQYISLSQALYKSITSCNKFLARKLSALPSRLLLLHFLSFFSHFLGNQTPSKDDNLEDERLKPSLP